MTDARPPWTRRVPLYAQVADHLRERIQASYQAGQKLEAESKLATELQVSLTTVREALGCLAQEGVVERKHGSGTYVRDPFGKQQLAILTELDINHTKTSYFFLESVQRLRAYLETRNIPVRVYVGQTAVGEAAPEGLSCPEFMEDVKAGRLRGVIAEATNFRLKWMQPLIERKIPVVGGSRDFAWSAAANHLDMVRQGAEYLLEAGRRRLGVIAPPGEAGTRIFTSTLQAAGVEVHPEWIVSESEPGREGAGWEAVRALWCARDEKPDGLIVCDDVMFQGVTMALLEAGVHVPEDLRLAVHVVGGRALHSPLPIARVEFDLDALIQAKAEMLLRLLRQEEIEEAHVRVPFRLVECDAHSTVGASRPAEPA